MINLSLNISNLHNLTIVDLNFRYTRIINRKFYSFEGNYDTTDELLQSLAIVSAMPEDIFLVTCELNNKVKSDEVDDVD